MDKIFEQIREERERQDAKWGEQNHLPFVWCSILGEEVGEVNKAALEYYFANIPIDDYKKELVQVAAVAVAMLECIERNKNVV